MAEWMEQDDSRYAHVEVLTRDSVGETFGYRLAGAMPGPQVVVAGTCPTSDQVFDRLLSHPALRQVHGNLVLIQLDALDGMLGDQQMVSPLGEIDRVLVLPWSDEDTASDAIFRRNEEMVLRVCADLGMTAGCEAGPDIGPSERRSGEPLP